MSLININATVASQLDRKIGRYRFDYDIPETADFRSYLDTPVYSPLEFQKVSGTDLDNSLAPVGGRQTDVLLRIDTCIITVTQTKNIVESLIQGRDGTIKEFISAGDYVINCSGLIVSPFIGLFPEDEVNMFIRLCELNKPIPVANRFLLRFGVSDVVIQTWNIDEIMGSRNSVAFSLTALQDRDEELIITKIV